MFHLTRIKCEQRPIIICGNSFTVMTVQVMMKKKVICYMVTYTKQQG